MSYRVKTKDNGLKKVRWLNETVFGGMKSPQQQRCGKILPVLKTSFPPYLMAFNMLHFLFFKTLPLSIICNCGKIQ